MKRGTNFKMSNTLLTHWLRVSFAVLCSRTGTQLISKRPPPRDQNAIYLHDIFARGVAASLKTDLFKKKLKLHSYGIRNTTLRWIQVFLRNRRQKVVTEGEESDYVPVTSGVPHDSVLGQILFLVYINDLPQDIVSQVRLFADDTAIYLTFENQGDSDKSQRDLDRLQPWGARWDMEFNPYMCQVVRVTFYGVPLQTQYILHGQYS